MEKINVDLQNCFGIQEMHHEFDFHGDNIIAIYAQMIYVMLFSAMLEI